MLNVSQTSPNWALTGLELSKPFFEAAAALNPFVLSYLNDVVPDGKGNPVMVFPGLGGHSVTTYPLRQFLKSKNHSVYDWQEGIPLLRGVNLGPSHYDMDSMIKRVEDISKHHGGRPVNFVGHSLGGILSIALAKMFEGTGLVGRVITLGSPVSEGTLIDQGSGVSGIVKGGFGLLNPPSDPNFDIFTKLVESIVTEGLEEASLTSVFSDYDGIVGTAATITSLKSVHTENVNVYSSHVGLVANPASYLVVADRLAQRDGEFKPFDIDDYPKIIKSLYPN
jgi:pimeloyl-ACP methyl ester carboxylesterase